MRQDPIEIKPDAANGKPVVKGRRISVQSMLELLAAGDDFGEVLKAYSSFTREHVLACRGMAPRVMGNRFFRASAGMKGLLIDENLPLPTALPTTMLL